MKLAKTYDPNQYEPNIYAMWENANAFSPTGVGEPFCVVMPPPNANGNLHLGHALTVGLEDIMSRYWRMHGRDVAYIPGADHAGFETWVVYDRILTEKGINRFDFSREQLYSQVWDFVQQQRGNMDLQLRALGASCSWQDLVFTLDSKVIKTVYGTFKKMWDEGLIYRGERIVNYSTKYQTSYADIEVDHKTEKGTLWNIAYPSFDHKTEIIVATTRPETIFGDTAIAVNPNDYRYKKLIGTSVFLPLTDKQIPIIADDFVDSEFGTGAVKVTPFHDPNDFEIGKRHNLQQIQVIGFDGKMMNVPSQFMGLDVDDARKKTLAALEASGFRRGESTIEHSVGYDYKSGLPIQPLIKDQWFVKIQPLAQLAKQAILDGRVKFTPSSRQKVIIQYLDNLRDWNLSRQIPWGIPIPAFQNIADADDWIFDDRVDQETISVNGKTYRREEDTFDTWFSSGQWPFITTDYLEGGKLSRFYPNSVMETGSDLLDRWIARMIMLGLYVAGDVPFKHVYLHGMVLDEKGQKMSKSKQNVINPMEAIAEFGSDALRLGLIASRTANQNQAFSMNKVLAGRNFCNKLWNIARFVENKIGDGFKYDSPKPETIADHWIIRELNIAQKTIEQQIELYRFAEAGETVYHTIWDSVADWYIEASKSQDNNNMLAWVLDTCLKLAHPFAPFVTETIWQTLTWHEDLLISAQWQQPTEFNEIAAAEFSRLIDLVTEIRFVASEIPGNNKHTLLYQDDSLIADNTDLIKRLAKLKDITTTESPTGIKLATDGRSAWLDISTKALHERQADLKARLDEVDKQIENLQKRLNNESYINKAPAKLIEESHEQLKEKSALKEHLIQELKIVK